MLRKAKIPPMGAFTPLDRLPAPKIPPEPPSEPLTGFQAKHPGGRPTKYRPEFCDSVIAAGRLGLSLTAFASTLDVDRDTITEWVSKYDQFSLAVRAHKAHRTLRWEQRLGKIADEGGGNGSAVSVIFGLKNVAPDEWRDRVEHTGANGGPIQSVQLTADLTKLDAEQRDQLRALLQAASAPKPE